MVALKFKATAKLFLLNSPCPSARRRVTIAVAAQPVLMKSFHIRPRILFLFPLAAMLGAAHLPAQSSVSLAPLPAVPGVPIPPMPSADELPTVVAPAATQPVTLIEDAQSYTLSNGIVTAQISKVAGTAGRSAGDLISLKYHGLEMLGFNSGHQAGYWETELRDATATVTIDPAKNDGARAEVSLKGAVGAFMQEERYALGRGESGVYTYAIYSHGAGQPAAAMGENRFGAKLNPALFDWLSVDGDRNLLMATSADWDAGTQMGSMKEARYLNTGIHKGQVEHKYDYCGYQFFTPAFGWSSTTRHVGIWFINPTVEFLGGGVTKDELDCHLDDNPGGDPLILDYWRGTHYGGCFCIVTAGEVWNKVVGPIFLYCNAVAKPAPAMADNANALFLDALAQAAKENTAWPYDWVNGVDYPHASERATVSGQLVLQDPLGDNHQAAEPLRRPRLPRRRHRRQQRRTGKRTPSITNSGFAATPSENSPSPKSAPAPMNSTPSPTASSANTPKPTSPSNRARLWTLAGSNGSPSATASNFGTSASPTASPRNLSPATTSGTGAGMSSMPRSFLTTSITPSASAIISVIGSSSKSPTSKASPARTATPRAAPPPGLSTSNSTIPSLAGPSCASPSAGPATPSASAASSSPSTVSPSARSTTSATSTPSRATPSAVTGPSAT